MNDGAAYCSTEVNGYHGYAHGLCTDTAERSPECQLRLPVMPNAEYFITINVTRTDFQGVHEYIYQVGLCMSFMHTHLCNFYSSDVVFMQKVIEVRENSCAKSD